MEEVAARAATSTAYLNERAHTPSTHALAARGRKKEKDERRDFSFSLRLRSDSAVSVFRCFGVAVFRCFGVSVFRCFGVSVFRCFGVSVFRCFGVSVFRCFGVSVVQSRIYRSSASAGAVREHIGDRVLGRVRAFERVAWESESEGGEAHTIKGGSCPTVVSSEQ